MKDVGILVLGHGSSLPFNKELVESLAQMIGKNNSSGPVRTAYLI
jgi:sirohydrochlorin cobaltochelatase